jgi:hypothetical protein
MFSSNSVKEHTSGPKGAVAHAGTCVRAEALTYRSQPTLFASCGTAPRGYPAVPFHSRDDFIDCYSA